MAHKGVPRPFLYRFAPPASQDASGSEKDTVLRHLGRPWRGGWVALTPMLTNPSLLDRGVSLGLVVNHFWRGFSPPPIDKLGLVNMGSTLANVWTPKAQKPKKKVSIRICGPVELHLQLRPWKK